MFHKIDVSDDLTLTTMIQKAEIHEYQDKFKVIEDLSKVIRKIDAETVMYVKKIYDVHGERYVLTYVTQTNMKEMLKGINVWKKEKKQSQHGI